MKTTGLHTEHCAACFAMPVCYGSPENPTRCAHRVSRSVGRVICLKELAKDNQKVQSSGQAVQPVNHRKVAFLSLKGRGSRIPSSVRELLFLLIQLIDWLSPTQCINSNLLYSESTEFVTFCQLPNKLQLALWPNNWALQPSQADTQMKPLCQVWEKSLGLLLLINLFHTSLSLVVCVSQTWHHACSVCMTQWEMLGSLYHTLGLCVLGQHLLCQGPVAGCLSFLPASLQSTLKFHRPQCPQVEYDFVTIFGKCCTPQMALCVYVSPSH